MEPFWICWVLVLEPGPLVSFNAMDFDDGGWLASSYRLYSSIWLISRFTQIPVQSAKLVNSKRINETHSICPTLDGAILIHYVEVTFQMPRQMATLTSLKISWLLPTCDLRCVQNGGDLLSNFVLPRTQFFSCCVFS